LKSEGVYFEKSCTSVFTAAGGLVLRLRFDFSGGRRCADVLGNRSGRQFALCFTPTETGLRISVVCEDGAYYSWTAGQADTVWSDAEYTAE